MRHYCLAALLLGLTPTFVVADTMTIAVVGVVIDAKTGDRRGGISVGLYCNKQADCRLGVSRLTSTTGVYALPKANFDADKAYVIYEGPAMYTANPVVVGVNAPPNKDEPCILYAADVELQSRPPADDARAIARYVRAYADTQRVLVMAGTIKAEEANEKVAREAGKLTGLSLGIKGGEADTVLKDVYKNLKEMPSEKDLPPLDVLDKEQNFLKLKGRPEFNRYRTLPKSPALWRTEPDTPLSSETFEVLLSLPNKQISSDWVKSADHVTFVRTRLKQMAPPETKVDLVVIDKKTRAPLLTESVERLTDEQIQRLLKDNAEFRAWAFYGTMTRERNLTKDQKREADNRSQTLIPFVIKKQN